MNTHLRRHKGLIVHVVLLCAAVGAGWFATAYLSDIARQDVLKENDAAATLTSLLLTNTFGRIEGAAKALSGSPWISPALTSGTSRDIANANDVLDRYNSAMTASVSYLMDKTGMVIASSNRNDRDSFVGNSYKFRPYFTQAISGYSARYLAVGTTSLKRGYYASFPVRDRKRGSIVGVVAIKKELDYIEAVISGNTLLFFIDPQGVVFLSNKREMLLKAMWPLSSISRQTLLASRQFGEQTFDEVFERAISDGMEISLGSSRYLATRRATGPEGWSIVVMNPTQRIILYRATGILYTLLICMFIAVPMIMNYKTAEWAEKLRESEVRFHELFNTMGSGVIVYRALGKADDFIITDINPAGERISQVRKEDVVGKKITDVFLGVKDLGLFDVLIDSWKSGEHKYHPVSRYQDSRLTHWVENNVYSLSSGEVVAIYDDITQRKQLEEEIRELSVTDQLTGLQNRRGFLSLAEQQLKMAGRNHRGLLLFFADLDGLKWINDTLGHDEGDKAIKEASSVLKETFRSSDIVARLGGDEFAALAIDIEEPNASIFADRLQSLVEARNREDNRKYRLSISFGCSYHDPDNPCSLDDLIASADALMYEQKKKKKAVPIQ